MTEESDEAFWSNRFHSCALAAGFLAASEGRLADSRYVQQLAYDLYERGSCHSSSLTEIFVCATPRRKSTEEEPHGTQQESEEDS
jgi:hypothetical protein